MIREDSKQYDPFKVNGKEYKIMSMSNFHTAAQLENIKPSKYTNPTIGNEIGRAKQFLDYEIEVGNKIIMNLQGKTETDSYLNLTPPIQWKEVKKREGYDIYIYESADKKDENGEPLTLEIWNFPNFPDKDVVSDDNIINFFEVAEQLANRNVPFNVHCRKGLERSAVEIVVLELIRHKKDVLNSSHAEVQKFIIETVRQISRSYPDRVPFDKQMPWLLSKKFINQFKDHFREKS